MPNCTNLSDNVPLYHCTISKIDLASQSSIILSYILYYNIIYKININTPPFPNDRTNQNTKWYIGTLVHCAAGYCWIITNCTSVSLYG